MPIEFIGPRELGQILESEYAKISQDYNRNTPKIVIGIPAELIGQIQDPTMREVAESQDRLNSFLEQQVAKVRSLLSRGKNTSQIIYRQIERELAELEQWDFPGEKEAITIYDPLSDSIYIAPSNAAGILIFGSGIQNRNNFQGRLRHELVHFDHGLTHYHLGIRSLYSKLLYSISIGEALFPAVETDTIDQRLAKPENAEFADSLQAAQGEVTSAALEREQSKIKIEIQGILEKGENSGISIAEEALAHNFYGGEKLFSKFVRGEYLLQHRDAMRLYARLGARIRQQGKATAIRHVEDAINDAFGTGKHVFDILIS